ncbi:hypothetical protein GCM10010430_37120 [Kitasatospora cystarginea]|uniref:Uncharacterized protein n=1 Tax=Kitasatospora cystarginea TaxID=58350 RepID=A0ABN3E7T1_9ACTN
MPQSGLQIVMPDYSEPFRWPGESPRAMTFSQPDSLSHPAVTNLAAPTSEIVTRTLLNAP